MASTIKIKRSSVAGKKPTTSDISTGELAINTKDFKLFSSNGTAIFELGNAEALANTNARINLINTNLLATNTALRAIDATKLAVSNAATLYATKSNPATSGLLAHTGRATISTNLSVSGNASVTGTMTASGIISGLELVSTNASGDEGGEVKLTKPPNGTLDGGVTIDAYQNKIRFFEQGGSARGAYIDLSACVGGAGTNLLAGGGSAANGFSGILVGANVIVADTTTDRLTLVAGSRIALAGNPTTDTITISASTTDYLQVANAASIYQTKAVERAALANTNSYIATRASWTALTGTNTALRTLINDRLQVANAVATYATKSNPTTSGLLAHTGRATISTNLAVSGNVSVTGTSTFTGAATFNGAITLGDAATDLLTVNGRATIGQNLSVSGNTTLGAAGKTITTTGLLAHTGRATISTNLDVAGNTTFSGTAKRITGDFSNATVTNRLLFQSSTGTFTDIGALGPGAAQTSGWTAYYGNDPTNTSRARMVAFSTDARFESSITGTGTYLPMTFQTGGLERIRIHSYGLANVAQSMIINKNLYVVGNTILGNPAVVTDRTIINGVTIANGQLTVAGNTVLSGTLVANSTSGVSGYYLRTSGTGVYWSPVSGGGANGFSGILVGANVVVADSTSDRLTFVAGSGIRLAANPTTDTITISTATANVASKAVKDLTQNDTVITSLSGVGVVALSATVSVGSTSTLTAGSNATVTNSGNTSAAVFNFGIPRGATGNTGPQGPAGIAAGLHTIWVPAISMTSRITNGAGTTTTESTTNKVTIKTLDFDTTTQEYAQFQIRMPKSWNEGTITFQPYWTAASGSGTVVWALDGVSLSNDDAIDTAFGTSQTSTDTLIAANDIHVGPVSSAITIAGTPVAEDIVMFELTRDVANDTLGVDARLIGIALFFTTDTGDDT